MGRPSRSIKPVNYAQHDPGPTFESDEEFDQERDRSMLDADSDSDDSGGSNYDAKEDRDTAEDDDKYEASDLETDQQGLNDTALDKGRKGKGFSMKRKGEAPKESQEILMRGAALEAKTKALLEEQRANDNGRLVNKAKYVTLPALETPDQFNAFGNHTIWQVDQAGTGTGDFSLHPFLSFLSSPWEKRPNFHVLRDQAGNPIRSVWRAAPPNEKEKQAAKMANGGVDRTLLEFRNEVLDTSKYPVIRDVTFLPNPVPLSTPSWRLVLYNTLGATPDDIAHRISKTDSVLNDAVVSHKQLRNSIRKKMDDWSKGFHGGFQWLEDRQKFRARKDFSEEPEKPSRARKETGKALEQKSRARTGEGEGQKEKSGTSADKSEAKEKEQKHEFASAILSGFKDRKAVSDLGYYFNTTWDIDIKLGVMRQPEFEDPLRSTEQPQRWRIAHPLWAPRTRDKIPQLLLDWRKEVAKLPDLPDLEDLIEDYRGEILLEDEYFEEERREPGVETGFEDEQGMGRVETVREEGTLPQIDEEVANSIVDPLHSPEKHTLTSSPASKPPKKKRRKM
ncbi:hypothetical protein FKW77_003863 [Venturia effusa]|uniref:Uncharacterized protein n=1 Tax=Venturia effusa TaxID=50376 RepID=A0A517L334_9PEZI|nr:hypothetical protein FKW77_003863 [Venturia effusa]